MHQYQSPFHISKLERTQFPRTAVQAEKLAQITKLDFVLNLELPQEILVQKACARRACADCGEGYNLANIQNGELNMPPLLPKVDGKCDKVLQRFLHSPNSDCENLQLRY